MTEHSYGLSEVDRIVAVASCKGGVGKSTVAAGLARSLAAQGFQVGLLDADIYGPSVPTLFGLARPAIHSNEFKMLEPVEAEGLKLMSFGFVLGDAPAVLRGPIVTRYIQQLLFQTAWGKLDYLLIDMPPGTGDVQLTVTQSVELTGAVIVTTRQSLSLVDVARGMVMFEKVQVPILGVVDNMAYFVCDSCEKKHYPFGHEHTLKQRFGVNILAEIPLMPAGPLQPYFDQAARAMAASIGTLEKEQPGPPQAGFDAHSVWVHFSDGCQVKVDNRQLRALCQCALCVNELSGQQLLDAAKIRPDIAPKELTPLGNYALAIVWNDGHSSSIYPYSLFREAAKSAKI